MTPVGDGFKSQKPTSQAILITLPIATFIIKPSAFITPFGRNYARDKTLDVFSSA